MPTPGRKSQSLVIACFALFALTSCVGGEAELKLQTKESLVALIQDQPELAVAESIALVDCMQALGWRLEYQLSVPAASRTANLGGVSGLFDDVSSAGQVGYTSSVTPVDQPTTVDTFASKLSQAQLQQFDFDLVGDPNDLAQYTSPSGHIIGSSNSGCVAQSRIKVYGSLDNFFQVAMLKTELANRVDLSLDSPRVVELMGDYSTCMSEYGVEVESIADTQKLAETLFFESRPVGSTPSPEERALAQLDATCQKKIDVVEALNSYFFDQASVWVAENEAWILGLLEIRYESLERANLILESVSEN